MLEDGGLKRLDRLLKTLRIGASAEVDGKPLRSATIGEKDIYHLVLPPLFLLLVLLLLLLPPRSASSSSSASASLIMGQLRESRWVELNLVSGLGDACLLKRLPFGGLLGLNK